MDQSIHCAGVILDAYSAPITNTGKHYFMVKRVLLAATVSWCSAGLLALLFAASVGDRMSLDSLRRSGVVPIALLTSTEIAVVMTPLVLWAFRSGRRSGIGYGLGLFVILFGYIALVTPINPLWGLYGSVVFGAVGLVIIGYINP